METINKEIIKEIRNPLILTIGLNENYDVTRGIISLAETTNTSLRMMVYTFIKAATIAFKPRGLPSFVGIDDDDDDDDDDDFIMTGSTSTPANRPSNVNTTPIHSDFMYLIISKIQQEYFLSIVIDGDAEVFDNTYLSIVDKARKIMESSQHNKDDANWVIGIHWYKNYINGSNIAKQMYDGVDPSKLLNLKKTFAFLERQTGIKFNRITRGSVNCQCVNLETILRYNPLVYRQKIDGISAQKFIFLEFKFYNTFFGKCIYEVLVKNGKIKGDLERSTEVFSNPQIDLTQPDVNNKRLFSELITEPMFINKLVDGLPWENEKEERKREKKRRKISDVIFESKINGRRIDNVFEILDEVVRKIETDRSLSQLQKMAKRKELFYDFWENPTTKNDICISLKDLITKVRETLCLDFMKISPGVIEKEKQKWGVTHISKSMSTILFIVSQFDLLLNIGGGFNAALLQLFANINVHNDMRDTVNIWLTGKSSIGKTYMAKLLHEFNMFKDYSQFTTLHKSAKFYAAKRNKLDYAFWIYPEAENNLMVPGSDAYQELLELMYSDSWSYFVLDVEKRTQEYFRHHNRCGFFFCSNHALNGDGQSKAAKTRVLQIELTALGGKVRHASEKKKQKDFCNATKDKTEKFRNNIGLITMVLTMFFHSRNHGLLKHGKVGLTELPYTTLTNRILTRFEKTYFGLGSEHSRILADIATCSEMFRLFTVVSELFFYEDSKYKDIQNMLDGKTDREFYDIFYEILNEIHVRNTPTTQDFIFAMCQLNFEITAKYLPQFIEILKSEFINYSGRELKFDVKTDFCNFFTDQLNDGKPVFRKTKKNRNQAVYDLNSIEIATGSTESQFAEFISKTINSKYKLDCSPEMIKYLFRSLDTKTAQSTKKYKGVPVKDSTDFSTNGPRTGSGNRGGDDNVVRQYQTDRTTMRESEIELDDRGNESEQKLLYYNLYQGSKECLTIAINILLLDKDRMPDMNPFKELMKVFEKELYYETSGFKEFMFFDNQNINNIVIKKLTGVIAGQGTVRKQCLRFRNKNFISRDSCFFNWSGADDPSDNGMGIITNGIQGYKFFSGNMNKKFIEIRTNLDTLVRQVYLRNIFTRDNFKMHTPDNFDDILKESFDVNVDITDESIQYKGFLNFKYDELFT